MRSSKDTINAHVSRRSLARGAVGAALIAGSGVARTAFAALPRKVKAMKVQAPGGLDNLKVDTAELRAPGPGEITVRLRASSLNFHDFGIVRRDGRTAVRIPLSDGAGNVVEVGRGVTQFKKGDAVISMFYPSWEDDRAIPEGFSTVPGDGIDGFAREMVTVPVNAFTRAPKNLSHREAATLSCAGVTAWRALMVDGQMKPGETVLTLGTGGVSVFAVQFAKMMGATVISTTSTEEKMAKLRALGADHVINYKTTPNWGEVAHQLTGGVGVDHIVETGGKGTFPQSIIAARAYGHIALIGGVAGGMPDVPGISVLIKRLRIIGIAVANRGDQLAMIEQIEKTNFKPVLDEDFPLEQLAEAFRHEESGTHFGKITVSI